jgi:iron complex outermembrane receptor protein/vitamin B12 transporter
LAFAGTANASQIRGVVTDSLGAIVPQANVELLENGKVISSTVADQEGKFLLQPSTSGRYQVRVTASSFASTVSDPVYLAEAQTAQVNVVLAAGKRIEQVTVTATGTPTPQAQTGSAVTILFERDFNQTLDIQESLRRVPGLQVAQTGQAGGTAGLFIRGGNKNSNKVLIDGVSASDIGGDVEFGSLASVGISKAEVQRGPKSALYGSDAMSGVVNLTTQRGSTPLPQLTYFGEGGNFGTYHQEGILGGAYKQLDYFSDYSRFDTANSIPNSQYHNGTFVGNYGWNLLPNTQLRGTVRNLVTSYGSSNAIELYGIPDDAVQKWQDTLVSGTLENAASDRWHNLLRYSALRMNSQYKDFAPTGIPFGDSSGDIFGYLGKTMTIKGANGYSVTGQAIFQYVQTYPNNYVTHTSKDFIYAQSDYAFSPHLVGLGAFKYEDERGYTQSTGGSKSSTDRGNYSYTMQLKGDLFSRLYYTVGSGIEKNAIFGVEATPRASLAFHLIRPGASHFWNGTKLRFSFGKGIKEPSIFYQLNSLYAVLAGTSDGASLIQQYHVSPIGAERSRSFERGVDQQILGGRGKIGVTYFHNQYTSGIEYVPQSALVGSLGVPTAVASSFPFGAAVNSQSFRSLGAELEAEYQISSHLFARGGYTYLDAIVQRSFSSDALAPSSNPNFPNVEIGWFSPLRGSRPFRRTPHSGYFGLNYSRSRWDASLTGTLVSRRDDSDFLYDQNFGTSLLLPNRNLLGSYQRLDLAGSYRVNHFLSMTTSMQNLLSQHYDEAFGYPALPFTFRSGVMLRFGGESWKLK